MASSTYRYLELNRGRHYKDCYHYSPFPFPSHRRALERPSSYHLLHMSGRTIDGCVYGTGIGVPCLLSATHQRPSQRLFPTFSLPRPPSPAFSPFSLFPFLSVISQADFPSETPLLNSLKPMSHAPVRTCAHSCPIQKPCLISF